VTSNGSVAPQVALGDSRRPRDKVDGISPRCSVHRQKALPDCCNVSDLFASFFW
jgi:hypothetical protein